MTKQMKIRGALRSLQSDAQDVLHYNRLDTLTPIEIDMIEIDLTAALRRVMDKLRGK